ncbi:MAG: ABC transporter permease, partial [Desulfovibrionales bacterium]|nr:ABC transporter permease [Desulfovibrionales bacterium]
VFFVFILTAPTIYGLGLLFASLVIWAKEVNVMVFLVRGLIMIFCGISFPLAVMPAWMQTVAKFIPMTYAIRAFRISYLTNQGFGAIKTDLIILSSFGVILFILGFIAFQRTEALVRKKGTLGVY